MSSQATIFRELLGEAQRLDCPAQLLGIRFIWIESFAFDIASGLSADYDGGYWHFYTLSNGAFYMAPEVEAAVHVIADNGYEGEMSADAFGITCCLYAYSLLSGSPDGAFGEKCAEQYHLLLAYMAKHAEKLTILRAVD